jgi:hypothetical protein
MAMETMNEASTTFLEARRGKQLQGVASKTEERNPRGGRRHSCIISAYLHLQLSVPSKLSKAGDTPVRLADRLRFMLD